MGNRKRRGQKSIPGPLFTLSRCQPFAVGGSGFWFYELPAVADGATQVGPAKPIRLMLLRMTAPAPAPPYPSIMLRRHKPSREIAMTQQPRQAGQGSRGSARCQIALFPGDPEQAVAALAPQIAGVPGDGRAAAADGADGVPRTPVTGRVGDVPGSGHDGPVVGPGEQGLEIFARDPDLLPARHLHRNFVGRETHDAVPRTAA
jgi:hypothetical protein